jgi:hypothetical protein
MDHIHGVVTQHLRCKVSSDVDVLERLRETYPWIPGRESVRPTEASRKQKAQLLENACKRYATLRDYVLHRIFRLACCGQEQGMYAHVLVVEKLVEMEARRTPFEREQGKNRLTRFVENVFAYDLPNGTRYNNCSVHHCVWLT